MSLFIATRALRPSLKAINQENPANCAFDGWALGDRGPKPLSSRRPPAALWPLIHALLHCFNAISTAIRTA
jgi:hypothetical protein